jgi:peptidoglycan/LPS O-acetylase OafA/YrhL
VALRSLSHARIPTLDGWRGIAILIVLFAHFQRAYLHHLFFGLTFLDAGQHGVTIFFVLSGYLITSGLIAQDRTQDRTEGRTTEDRTEDRIDLRSFYIRRVFRIMPAALVYLLFLVLLTALTPMKAIGGDLWQCLLFCRNYFSETRANTCTMHFWSLSVEEQFYFVWPAVLALCGRKGGAAIAVVATAGIAIFRILHWNYYLTDLRFQHTEVQADSLLVGCLLALALAHSPIRAFFVKNGRWLFLGAALVAVECIYHHQHLLPLRESLAIAVMIGTTALNPQMLVGKLLEMEHLKTTGLMSYSIYLWQGVFFRDTWGVLGFILLPIAAFISWLFVEKHGIAMGRRLLKASTKTSKASSMETEVAG